MKGTPTTSDSGFTLIETLVSLAILAATIAAFHIGLGGGWRGIAIANGESRAVALAQSRLAEMGVTAPLAEGSTSGDAPDGLRWRSETRPHDNGTRGPLALYRVTVRVTWPDAGGAPREVVLETVKMGGRTP